MMGQELFEHPKKQYKTYGITALEDLARASVTPKRTWMMPLVRTKLPPWRRP